mmetsp:Transcript_1683/g.2533  ORF Transcript_1683/g.2533 Transcript_1683/m.2533 type:complete len:364 (-) Transcript_1683:922-2013(-)
MSLPHMQKVVRMMQRPVGEIQDGDLVLREEKCPTIEELKDGEILVHRLFLSLDPAMRGWMRDLKSYIPPVKVGEIMRGGTICEVVASKHAGFKVGDVVQGAMNEGWTEFAIQKGKATQKLPPIPGLPLSAFLGVLGGTGMTAYFGLLRVGVPKAGETVLVSGAAGATGSVVCQIAKILGCKVVGIAGGSEKCRWLKEELGLDGTIDYKAANGDPEAFQQMLRQNLKGGVDVFFDNVGGMILNEVLRRLNMHARVVICGAISGYNEEDPRKVPAPSNYLSLLTMRAKMEGFIVFDYVKEFPIAVQQLASWINEGKLAFKEDVRDGLENATDSLKQLYTGGNKGKLGKCIFIVRSIVSSCHVSCS